MTKLIRMQKRLVVVMVSFLLAAAQRTVGLARPLRGHARDNGAQIKSGLLFRLSPNLRSPLASLPKSYYAAELNGLFPYVHLHQIPASATYFPQVFSDAAIEISDGSGLTVFSLSDTHQAGNLGDLQNQTSPSVCPISCCNECGGGTDCGTSTGCGGTGL
jgi:hypothetical protein